MFRMIKYHLLLLLLISLTGCTHSSSPTLARLLKRDFEQSMMHTNIAVVNFSFKRNDKTQLMAVQVEYLNHDKVAVLQTSEQVSDMAGLPDKFSVMVLIQKDVWKVLVSDSVVQTGVMTMEQFYRGFRPVMEAAVKKANEHAEIKGEKERLKVVQTWM